MFTTQAERDQCKWDFKRLPQYDTHENKEELKKYEDLLCSGPMWKRSRHGKGLIVDRNFPHLKFVAAKYRNYAEGKMGDENGKYEALDKFLHQDKKAPPRTKSWLHRIPAMFSRKTYTQDELDAAYDNSGVHDLRSGGRRRKTRRRKSRRR